MTVTDLKELAPFLAVVVSMLALTIGPYIAGRVARAQSIAGMREKWIYAFRDCLVELLTEFDVLHESHPIEGLPADEEYETIIKRLRALTNRARLMVNTNEPIYDELLNTVERIVDLLMEGISVYEEFHALNAKAKRLAQEAIRNEWKKIAP